MAATIEEVRALADVPKFLEETGRSSTHKACHNALAWLAVQIRKANLSDYNIHLCEGRFAGFDHSWLMVENPDDESHTIIDMTVDQFENCDVPYIGPMSPKYVIDDSVTLCDQDNLMNFIERLG